MQGRDDETGVHVVPGLPGPSDVTERTSALSEVCREESEFNGSDLPVMRVGSTGITPITPAPEVGKPVNYEEASHVSQERSAPIETLDSLREHLQWAIELEHATLPPYLCALYSLDRDRNPDAAEVVGSVLIEEMLHLTLAANILNAVGGRPKIDTPRLLRL